MASVQRKRPATSNDTKFVLSRVMKYKITKKIPIALSLTLTDLSQTVRSSSTTTSSASSKYVHYYILIAIVMVAATPVITMAWTSRHHRMRQFNDYLIENLVFQFFRMFSSSIKWHWALQHHLHDTFHAHDTPSQAYDRRDGKNGREKKNEIYWFWLQSKQKWRFSLLCVTATSWSSR